MAANENVGVYEPGADVTCTASAPIVGKTFVWISGDRSLGTQFAVGPSAPGPATMGNITVATASAGGLSFGVSKYDQLTVGLAVGVSRGPGRVTYVTAGAVLTAGQEVQSDASGKAIPLASGRARGYAVTSCAAGADAEISIY